MSTELGGLIQNMRGQAIELGKKLVLDRLAKDWPTMMTTPVLGPVLGFVVGKAVGFLLNTLADEAEFLAFMANTYIRVQGQAKVFEKAAAKIESATTTEQLEAAEREALESFDDLAKFNR